MKQSFKIPGTLTAYCMVKWPMVLRNSLANFPISNNSAVGDNSDPIKEETQEIVQFTDEGVAPTSFALPSIVDLTKDYLTTTVKEDRVHDVISFLSRPIIIHTGRWTTSAGRADQLYTANFPELLLSNAMYSEKLSGFVGLRATLCLKLQVNSQPFQQGRLMLQYFPYAQYMANRVTMVNRSLQGRSGCPRSDLDLGVATECSLCIPYVSPHLFYNLVTGQGSFGACYIVVYSPLLDLALGGFVDFTLWAWLEDIDIQYPTGAPLFTGSAPNRVHLANYVRTATDDQLRNLKPSSYLNPVDTIFAQTEQDFMSGGSASRGVGQIASGLDTLTQIPLIGNLFTRPAWITTQFSNILKFFGFSKPSVSVPTVQMRNRTAPNFSNFDGLDMSHKMALFSENSVESVPGLGGTDIDEMALSRIISIPNYWTNFSWSSTDGANSALYTQNVHPYLIRPYSSTILDRFLTTHLGYVAQCFGMWRGSMVFTFKFVKTKFHSGRCLIQFVPFSFAEAEVPFNIDKTYKMVVDLRTQNEVTFTVPYVSSRPWMYCGDPIDPDFSSTYWNFSTGAIYVSVLNQLKAASTVSPAIDVLVEVNAGPDMVFSAPSNPRYIPSNHAPTSAVVSKLPDVVVTTPEKTIITGELLDSINKELDAYKCEPGLHTTFIDGSGDPHLLCPKVGHAFSYTTEGELIDRVIETQGVGTDESIPRNEAQFGRFPNSIDQNKVSSNWSPEAFCIGEKIFSVRQLIKRFGFAGTYTCTTSTSGTLAINPFLSQRPNTAVANNRPWTYYDYFYYIYAFYRGGMRVKLCPITQTTPGGNFTRADNPVFFIRMYNSFNRAYQIIMARIGTSVGQATPFDGTGLGGFSPAQVAIDPHLEGLLEFEVPFYNVSHIVSCSYQNVAPRSATSLVTRGFEPFPLITVSSGTNISDVAATHFAVRYYYYRAPADDFSFMYLTGVPMLDAQVQPPV
nr:MAG: hypothetical protein 2 [Dicistroviridae sp.]